MSADARFSIIPGWIVTDGRLKGCDLQVLCLLGRHTDKHGWCRRSQVKMADQLGKARSTVQASIDRLVDIGVLEKHVEPSVDGRDSAHSYRVIYDRAPPSGYDFDAYRDEDEKEYGPIPADQEALPPAGIPAPPAGPESAPPAGPGPAPINDPYLTTQAKREEREREREDGEGEENPKALERRFRKWWRTWPSYAVDDEAKTRRAWLSLTFDQQKACEERTAEYLAAVKASGRQFSKAASTYLSERAWERLGDIPVAPVAAAETYTAYSRPWSAARLAALSQSPVPLRLSPLEQSIIDAKPEKEGLIWRDKREKAGWPEAVKLHEAANARKRVTVPAHIVELAQGFDKVQVGGSIWDAWKRLHHERCWPWLPEPHGLDWVQFPTLPEEIDDPDQAVREALRRFQRKLIEGRDENDAA